MTSVLFWDIDGTLLSTARAGVFALEEAVREVLGVEPDFSELHTAGLTDWQVAELAIETATGEAPDPATTETFLRSYERHLPARLHRRRGRVMEGVEAILEDLADRPGVVSLLLTGNTPEGARAKLGHYGLDHWFDGGGFCLGPGDRAGIARRARELAAERAGGELDGAALYVIGDTTHDVACGKAIGARTVALATGPVPPDELRRAEPWLLLERLPAPERFRELLRIG